MQVLFLSAGLHAGVDETLGTEDLVGTTDGATVADGDTTKGFKDGVEVADEVVDGRVTLGYTLFVHLQ